MKKEIKVGICQLAGEASKPANLAKAEIMLRQAAASGCRLLILPEMFNCPYSTQAFPDFAEAYPAGETIAMLAQTARSTKTVIVGGSIPERGDDGQLYNTSFIFDDRGQLIGRHRKIHLLDVELSGGTAFQESATLSAGREITVIKRPELTFGVAICYDIRFPELARLMVDRGAKLLIYPAAFSPTTGPAHWQLLMRARAVDNQVFVIGAAPAKNPAAAYQAYGHSLAVDPWGEILREADDRETLLTVTLDLARVAAVRRQLPLLKHRRPAVYGKWWDR